MATTVIETHNQEFNYVHMPSAYPVIAESPQQQQPQQRIVTDSKKLIGEALHQRVQNVDHQLCEPGDEDTFFVADLGEVYRQHMRWKKNLPGVRPFYGKLCLPVVSARGLCL